MRNASLRFVQFLELRSFLFPRRPLAGKRRASPRRPNVRGFRATCIIWGARISKLAIRFTEFLGDVPCFLRLCDLQPTGRSRFLVTGRRALSSEPKWRPRRWVLIRRLASAGMIISGGGCVGGSAHIGSQRSAVSRAAGGSL